MIAYTIALSIFVAGLSVLLHCRIYMRNLPITGAVELVLLSATNEPEKWKRVGDEKFKHIDTNIIMNIYDGYDYSTPELFAPCQGDNPFNEVEIVNLNSKERNLIRKQIAKLESIWKQTDEKRRQMQLVEALGEDDPIVRNYLAG